MKILKGLTQVQQEDLNGYLGLDKIFDAYPTKRDIYKPVKDEAASFKTNIKNISDAIVNKMVDSTEDTDTKNKLKLVSSVYWGNINSIVHGFALKYNFGDLAKMTKLTCGQLMDIADTNYQPRIQVLATSISDYSANTDFIAYNVTDLVISKGLLMAKTFADFLGTNKQTEGKSSVAVDEIERLFLPAKANFTQFGFICEYFSPEGLAPDEEFYKAIQSGLIIPHSSTHTIYDGHIYHQGTELGIKGATIKNLKNGRMVESDLLGYFKMEKFQGGTIQFEISAPGYVTQTVILEIKRSKHISIDYHLVQVV